MTAANPADTVLTGLRLVLPDRVVSGAYLTIRGPYVTDTGPQESLADLSPHGNVLPSVVDFAGDYAVPGLIDLHVHGCGGADTMDASPQAFDTMAAALLRHGTTAFLATTMTAPSARLEAVFEAGMTSSPSAGRAELLGFHLEGPCLSPLYQGAQQLTNDFGTPQRTAGNIRIITLAPEQPDAEAYTAWGRGVGAILSVGHSAATYEQMRAALEDGFRYVTHAFNAMPGIHHRAPGLLAAALLDERVTIELIADGVHVHPAVLELAMRLKGIGNVVLVSDGTRATGMPEGSYELGGRRVTLSGGRMTLPDGTIAGSASSLLDGVRFVTQTVGRPLWEAVRMATLNPARLLGLDGSAGCLRAGAYATLLRLSPDLTLKEVWVRGKRQEVGTGN